MMNAGFWAKTSLHAFANSVRQPSSFEILGKRGLIYFKIRARHSFLETLDNKDDK